MWVATNRGFLSIVRDRDKPGQLLVRARGEGHIQAIFGPGVRVFVTRDRDYLYRACIPAEVVSEVLSRLVQTIDYTNFKASVGDDLLQSAYTDLWATMAQYQRLQKDD